MPRSVVDQPIHTRTGRSKLTARGKPYFRRVTDAIAIGYRKGKVGAGRWVIRERKADGDYTTRSIPGVVDDELPADGGVILSYDQAVTIATQGVKTVTDDLSVKQAIDDWASSRINSEDNPAEIANKRSEAKRLSAPFSNVTLKTIRARDIERWRDAFLDGYDEEEARRKRRATANKNLRLLKAALNAAAARVRIKDRAWDAVKPFKREESFGKRVITMTPAQEAALVQAAEPGIKELIIASFLTGARYGELAGARVGDLSGNRLKVSGKTGARSIVLSADAMEFFSSLANGANDLTRHLLLRADGKPWKTHDQVKPFARAVVGAGLNPDATLYCARHSYITRALSNMVPITAVAKQCGTSVEMIERTYSNFTNRELDEMFSFVSRP